MQIKTMQIKKIKIKINKNHENIEYNNEINIIYNINSEDEDEKEDGIHIFGEKFVENNKDKCKIVFKNKEYELMEYFYINDYNNNKLKKLQIKLKYINNIIDMSYMFYICTSLSSLPDIYKWNTNNVTNMSYMFENCTSLS